VGCNQQSASLLHDDVTIGYSALRISLPIFVAQEKGYFAEEGLNVNLQRFDTAQPMMDALVAGNVEVAGYTAVPITYNAMLRSGTDLYFASVLLEDQQHRLSYLIVPKSAPDTMKISDLKGKKIGILPTVAYKVWIEEILKAKGVQPADVQIVQLDPTLTVTAFQSGQVDALFTNDPVATTVLQKGIGRLISNDVELPSIFGEPFLFGSFNIRKDFADQHPETTQKIVRALDKAIAFTMDNQTEAKQLMKKYLAEAQKPFVDFYPDALYQNSTQVDATAFQKAADTYLDIGIIKKPLNVEHLILKAQ
jgi:ABC-type nitrate/sulfonate/bicarbonate transport system substrate-binding protein